MRRLAAVFMLGVCAPVVLALYAGGENIAQAGLRLAAVEQGFALAGRHWQFEATPEHAPQLVAQSEPQPAVVRTKPGKGRR